MNEMYIGSIYLLAYPWLPAGVAFCNGQLLQISQYQTLFYIIGTIYGGDGITTFALPDLRSRVPIGAIMGSSAPNNNLTPLNLTAVGGTENTELINHTHTATVNNIPFDASSSLWVSSKPATLATPIIGCSIAAPMTWDGITLPPTPNTPAFGFIEEAKNPVYINALPNYVQATSGHISISDAGTAKDGIHANLQPFLGLNYVICIDGINPNPTPS